MSIKKVMERLTGIFRSRNLLIFILITLLGGSNSLRSEDEMPVFRGTPEETAIRDRIGQAQKRQSELSASSGMDKDLVLFADFEQDNMLFIGNGGFFNVELPKDHYLPGRHGRGFFFEKPGDNQLPQNIADVEKDISGFQSIKGAEIKSIDEKTKFGEKVLSVKIPTEGSGFKTIPVKTTYATPMTGPFAGKAWRLVASCYVKGPKGAKILIEVAPIQDDVKKVSETAENKNGTQKDVAKGNLQPAALPDKIKSEQVILSGEWERIACGFALDVSRRNVMATFSLISKEPEAITLLADGFQFEESMTHLAYDGVPASWIPGGTRRPATPIQIGGQFADSFPVREGSIVYWMNLPSDSSLNLKGPNGGPVLSFGNGQWVNSWQIGPQFRAGGEGGTTIASGGRWQHVAMTWDGKTAYVYCDGKLNKSFDRKTSNLSVPTGSVFMIGGNIQPIGSANSILDDVGVFKRKLTEEEIMSLASEQISLHSTSNDLLFEPIGRSVFYRDENKASFEFRIKSLQQQERPIVDVDFCIGDAIYAHKSIKMEKGMATACFEFSPSHLKSGSYLVCLVSSSKTSSVYWEAPVSIISALRPDHFMLSSWGSPADAEWLDFYKKIGLNTVDTTYPIAEYVGRKGFLYGWHNDFSHKTGIWSAQGANRQAISDTVSKDMAFCAAYPNWKFTLVNSEKGIGGFERNNQFDSFAEKILGFPIPAKENWQLGHPMFFKFPDNRKPDPNGVFRDSHELQFLRWGLGNGTQLIRLNSEIADTIHKIRPDVKVWTDPIAFSNQVDGIDAGGNWSYNINSESMIGDFEYGCALVRGSGKEYYCTLGMWYYLSPVFGANVPTTDLKKLLTKEQFEQMLTKMSSRNKVEKPGNEIIPPSGPPTIIKADLAPTGDDMVQQAWIAVGYIPSDGLTYWYPDGLFRGVKRDVKNGTKGERIYYAESGSDERLGTTLKNDILPIGTMLKGVKNAQRPFALLVPESSRWALSGDGGMWWWGTEHYTNLWKMWLGTTGIPYDIVFDHNITPGSLAKYRTIFFPMAHYVEERIYKELMFAGENGTKIVVDKYCRQEYPNMEKWNQQYLYHPELTWNINYSLTAEQKKVYDKKNEYHRATLEPLEALKKSLLPKLDAYAIGNEGSVFMNIREYHGVKYVVVINNNRQPGPYTEWTNTPFFMPYGKAQKVTVYLKAHTDSTVYDFVESQQLPVKIQDNHLVAEITLPPHAGRLLCVYPKAFKKMTIFPPEKLQVGMPATIGVALFDVGDNPVKGRQLVNVRVLDPAGKEHDETGIYRLEDGKADIPFRPALNEAAGQWRIEIVERTSGLKAASVLAVSKNY